MEYPIKIKEKTIKQVTKLNFSHKNLKTIPDNITSKRSIRRAESLPNYEQAKSNYNLCVFGSNEPPLYLSLKNKYFKMTSHALINISTFKTTKRDNQIGKKII